MRHKMSEIEKGILLVEASEHVDIDSIQRKSLFLADSGVMTFGNTNHEIFKDKLIEQGHSIEDTYLCLDDDISLGLQMPETSYINKGTNALSIAMYYNFLTFKEQAKKGVLFQKNKLASDRYGRVGVLEVYIQEKLELFLLSKGLDYFGTPKTLTECMRVLEGWKTSRVPRLKSYVPYSSFIKLWCEMNFPEYKASEWGLGKETSELIFEKTGETNVRAGIKYFWNNYLTRKNKKISPGDVEIDILGGDFYKNRQPDFVLLGEDIFSETKTSKTLDFKHFTNLESTRVHFNVNKNKKHLESAKLAKEMFPGALIVVIQNPKDMLPFTMCKLDEIKQGISREVAVVVEVLSEIFKK